MDVGCPDFPFPALTGWDVWLREHRRQAATFELVNQGQGLLDPRGKAKPIISYSAEHAWILSFCGMKP